MSNTYTSENTAAYCETRAKNAEQEIILLETRMQAAVDSEVDPFHIAQDMGTAFHTSEFHHERKPIALYLEWAVVRLGLDKKESKVCVHPPSQDVFSDRRLQRRGS